MKHILFFLFGLVVFLCPLTAQAADEPNDAVKALIDRIGGVGAAERFVTRVEPTLSADGRDVFVLSSVKGKPCIAGSSVSAVTTGLNWYLNHVAHINLTWNCLTTDLTSVPLPLPATEERHVSTADYRYYLNYCTFSYSMAFWTWERWQQEIDWMALHGINMPLALVGADVVWKNVLTRLGYDKEEINAFIAGPGFQAWWLMNNLEGWGGENKDWWYTRQETLAKNILARMRSLGMTPVLPGYSGMVPHNITAKKGWKIADPGTWCKFQRPGFLLPTDSHFEEMSDLYYEELTRLMGTSTYYSMDPFHEGGNTAGVDLPAAYRAIQKAMDRVNPDAKWVIQSWNENPRGECLRTIPKGKLVILDLFSEAVPRWRDRKGYSGHETVYCMLHNFGGRVGLHGRLATVQHDYYEALATYPDNLKGVGATPEGIETNPMLYDALFELPWQRVTSTDEWLAEYAVSRYGKADTDAAKAWRELSRSVYDCRTSQQGTSEPVLCARPSLRVASVSTWSTSRLHYDPQSVLRATAAMLSAGDRLSGTNYDYDLVDVTRQSLSNYAQALLAAARSAYEAKDMEGVKRYSSLFLRLILDQDRLLSTTPEFTLGRWTEMARAVPDEIGGTGVTDKEWMEWNARTQITVWGTQAAANQGGLHDYSNREWSGLLRDFHYARWKRFFDALLNGTPRPDNAAWYAMEADWTKDFARQYTSTPSEAARPVARQLFARYFGSIATDSARYYFSRGVTNDATEEVVDRAFRGMKYRPTLHLPDEAGEVTLSVDFDGDGIFSDAETARGRTVINIPSGAVTGRTRAQLTMADGTQLDYTVVLRDKVKKARRITATSSTATQGYVRLANTEQTFVNHTEEVTMTAYPASGYIFSYWTDRDGHLISHENPYTYYGRQAADFRACFLENRWGKVEEDLAEMSTVESYGQYISSLTVETGSDTHPLLTATDCPKSLFHILPEQIDAARGSSFTLSWSDPNGGLSYCRLSAYIDLNADGDFDDKGELLEVRGDKDSSGNRSVSRGTLRVLLPYDIATGVTHLRLRFDGAWSGGWDAVTDAKPSKAAAQRMVYDMVVNITDHATRPALVTVRSANPEMGTVAISGLDNPATVKPGVQIHLQAQPGADYDFVCWKDAYGRVVSTTQNYMMSPAESGTFTAHFRQAR